MSDLLPNLSGQLELGKAQKLLMWTKISVPADLQIGGIGLEKGKNTSEDAYLLLLPYPPQHSAYTVSFPSPFSLGY